MSFTPADLLVKEAAMYKDDCKRLGSSAKDNLLRERLTTAISAVKTLAYVQEERDWLHRSAQEDATRLADEHLALKRKNPGSESESQPQPKRARPRRACSAALSHEYRLEMAKDRHDRAVERVQQIEREYAGRVDQAEVAANRARCGVWKLTLPGFVTPEDLIDHSSSPATAFLGSDDAPAEEFELYSTDALEDGSPRRSKFYWSSIDLPSSPGATLLNSDDAPAEEFELPSTDASEDEGLPPPKSTATRMVDMSRRLSQSLQDRRLVLIDSNFKKTFTTTWNDGEQEVNAVVKLAPRSNIDGIHGTMNEIAIYHRLRPLQGTCIPKLLDYGRAELDGTKYFAIVMECIEDRELVTQMLDVRPSIAKLSVQERAACQDAIKKMHELGVIHWDIRGSNLMFRDNLPSTSRIPVFIGFANAAIVDDINDEDEDEDYACLDQMFEVSDFPL